MPISPTPPSGAKTSSSEEVGMGQRMVGEERRLRLGAHPPLQRQGHPASSTARAAAAPATNPLHPPLQGGGRERSERGGGGGGAAGAGTPPRPPTGARARPSPPRGGGR